MCLYRSRIMAQAIAVVCGLITRCRGACSLIVVGGAATNQLIMGKRPVDVVDLTGTDVFIDLTSDSNECVGDTKPLLPIKSNIEIPWTSKLPKHDPSKKIKVARRLSVRDNINISELRKDAVWFEEAELLFRVAMAP